MHKDTKFTRTAQKLFLAIGLSVVPIFSAQTQDSFQVSDSAHLSLVFAGDIMGHDTQILGAYDSLSKSYNYAPVFRYIADYIKAADVAVGNLEVTLAGPPYKGYPQFSSPDELALAARDAGFDVMITANNHALDRGEKGFLRTLDMLDSLQFLRAGTYRDSVERVTWHPLLFEKNGIRIALLNYTYGTNGLKIAAPREINRIDRARMKAELDQAKVSEADYIIVCMHWGVEYERNENQQQEQLARFLFANGADAIIGSHPHVVQPVRFLQLHNDTLTRYPVVYSLGNFVSNQRAQYKDGGIVAELHLSKVAGKTVLDSMSYLPYWVWRDDLSRPGQPIFQVLPVAKYEAAPDSIYLTPGDIYRLKRFAKDTREHITAVPESGFYKGGSPIRAE